jgi:sugar phosphate isomerase/epimerase
MEATLSLNYNARGMLISFFNCWVSNMALWPLGVFTSIDAGLGVDFNVLSRLGISTIHLHAPSAYNRSSDATATLVADLLRLGIEVTCVFAGFKGESYANIPTVSRTVGLVPVDTRETRLAELMSISDFAARIGVKAIGLHLGCIPHEVSDSTYQDVLQSTREICDYCRTKEQAVHLETGQEPAEVLLDFLGNVDRDNLFVNFDPANMILYGCGEPIPALKKLGPYVRSVHCKDAKWSDQPGVTWGTEVPLGQGDVGFAAFLGGLAEIGYQGPLTIEREIPREPDRQEEEIRQAADLLNRLKLEHEQAR